MLTAVLRRFASREAVLATAAQAALTWGANHLSAQVAEQAQRVAELEADLETTRQERDAALEELAELQPEHEAMRDVVNDYQLSKVVENRKAQSYPAAEDVDPLGQESSEDRTLRADLARAETKEA